MNKMRRLRLKLISSLALVLGASAAQAVTIDAVYFGQTHVLKATDPYFGLVGNREALIKVHVTDPATPASPAVSATLSLSGQTLVLPLTGPATLPASVPDGLGVVQHSSSNSFTAVIPAAWVKKGLQVSVNAGTASTSLSNLDIGAPTKVIMTMFDVQYFSDTNDNYPANTFAELEAKWPVADLEVRRLGHVVFPELVIPPRTDVGTKAARVKSKAEYTVQTGLPFDGEQAAALAWNAALKRAAGRSGRWSLYYLNVYNAFAGGQAGGFAGVGSGTSLGILQHELGHALSLPHWGDNVAYPYKGDMHGIQAPVNYNETHAGPAWAFDLRTRAFIPPTVQANNVGGKPVGTYKVDPMQGGGAGWQEPAYLMNHFSDYSMDQMRSYLQSHVVVWNQALGSYASWNQTAGDYTTTVTNNGVQFPTVRDTEVISILASISGSDPGVTMVYPPIGPYTAGRIRLFDPTVAADRTAAQSIFSPANGSDLCVRVVQGGVQKTYMLAASWLTTQDPYSSGSLVTEAINLPAADGAVTRIELLLTPNVEDVGLPANPQVLATWAPLTPDPATFEAAPQSFSSSAITMQATEGATSNSSLGAVEYRFTETSGNPGATSSAWQSSRSYTDVGLQPGTQYSYTVSLRAGALSTAPSAVASAVTRAAPATRTVTVDATRQFTLQSGRGFRAVSGLGTFDAGGADKLVVVISTEDGNNSGTGFVYDVRYNGKLMTEAIQEEAGIGNGTAAIFYLDNPGAIGTGTIEVSAENPNGGIGAAYALSNTQPGFGASTSATGSTANSVGLTTAGDRSVVIAVLENSGKPNTAGTPTATAPLTQVSSGSWGSQWGGHASGYQLVTVPGPVTPTFATLTGIGYSINLAVAEFPAQLPLPNLWTQTAGGTQNWTTATNWDDGVVPNPTTGTTMDFSTVNILANTTLVLGANRTARIWKFGDTSGTQTWTVGAGNSMTLGGSTPTIEVNNATTQLENVVAGTAGLTKTGAGTLILRGANTYSGATDIHEGTLVVGNVSALPSTSTVRVVTATGAGTLRLAIDGNPTTAFPTSFGSSFTGGTVVSDRATPGAGIAHLLGTAGMGTNTYDFTSGTNVTSGTGGIRFASLNLSAGGGGTTTLNPTTANLTILGAVTSATVTAAKTLSLGGTSTGNSISGAISDGTGPVSLTKSDTSTWALSAANTYTGNTTIEQGTLKVAATGAIPSGPGKGNVAFTTAADIATLDLNGFDTIVNGLLQASTSTTNRVVNHAVATAKTLTVGGDDTTSTFAGVIADHTGTGGTLALTKTGTGTLTLGSGSTTFPGNTYTGATLVSAGILSLNVANAILNSSGVTVAVGATLQEQAVSGSLIGDAIRVTVNGAFELDKNETIGGLSGSGTVMAKDLNNSNAGTETWTLTVGGGNATSSFSGTLQDDGADAKLSLTKIGTGTQTLSGAIGYGGNTTVSAGTLTVSQAANALNANPGNDASTITLAATGASLNLTYAGTDRVNKLFIAATQMAPGVYGKSGSASPIIGIPQITGNGTLTVASGPVAPSFSSWITGTFTRGQIPAGQQGAHDDYDKDGIPNLLEYAVAGQDPTVPNVALGSFTGNTLSFSKRTETSGLTYVIEDSTDLGLTDAWAEVTGSGYVNNATAIAYTFTPGNPVRLFARLRLIQAP